MLPCTCVFGSDIGNIDRKSHVVVVDNYSFFLYERPMPDMSSDTLILPLKTIFNKSGVPTILIRQWPTVMANSEEFKQFSLDWSFKTSSLYYLKGNSCAECAVGIVKEVYTKCKDDFLLGLLVH